MLPHEKACTKCGEVKPLDGFHRDKNKKDGRKYECKECMRERNRRWHEENRDKERERLRRYREENRDKERERHRRWREENRDKKREYHRRYREENRDKVLERSRRYREENREYARARARNAMRDYQRSSEAFIDKPKWSPWTPEEDAFLLANDGRTYYQKAIELGRTHGSVSSRLRYLRQTQTT